jgi:NADH-quinone oxidoreductase subunit E
MLTPEEIGELETVLADYPQRRSGCVDALKIVQRRRGWISDETLRDAAEYLGMTAEELEAVATFYPVIFRRPVGRHVIRICDSVSCWIVGYEQVYRTLADALGVGLGETTGDGRFTLLPTACLGVCEHAPALMIDSDLIADINPENVNQILSRYP